MKLQLNTVNAALSACYGGMQACAITVKRRIRESEVLNRAHETLFSFLAGLGLIACATSYNVWSNANIDIETSAATPVAITGISKANPGVVTHSGTDPSNGDYVKLTNIVGMVELNDQVFRVSGAAAGSFNLEGIDTTAMTTFVSGTFEVITFGVSMTTVQDVNSGGGDFQFADLTTIHDTLQKRIPTTASPFTMSLGCLFNPADAAHIELEQANDTKSVRAVRVRWATGAKAVWLAYVGASGIPQGQAQGTVKTAVNFEGQGKPRFYST